MSVFNLINQNEILDNKITAGVEKLSSVFRILLWEQSKQNGLSPIQIQILIFIKHHNKEQCTVSYLAKEFSLTKPTISDAVKVLEQKKLTKKSSSKEDVRSYFLQLTASGIKIVKEAETYAEPFNSLIKKINTKDKELFWKTLSSLIHQLNQIDLISVQRMCFSCQHYQFKKENHFCNLLSTPLKESEIRLDCPEHQDKN
jgi:DNA-binding MarR family transcriptional regulator